ncbi:pyruvate ferredoxin oxidoreductase [Candidatus Woesearchaeota archaeon]|nr:pyruvate ferredoxin oxidoreductase [Candidatus Woesearchaeota archaeon]
MSKNQTNKKDEIKEKAGTTLTSSKQKITALTGAHAVAEAMRQINPDVVAVFPITPQTEIMEQFAQYHADGIVDSEIIRTESEHSSMSCVVGASAAGARAMTATSSAGLAYMWEVVGIASGLRLPIVMPVVNRALSAPINIHCDHSDAMGCRDHGWIMLFCENAQEAYDATILAVKLAEHPEVMLPVMVCQDGFITSHAIQNIKVYDDKIVKNFVREYKPRKWLLNTDEPVTVGPLQLTDYYFESQKQRADAIFRAKEIYLEVGKEFSGITGKKHLLFESYMLDDAEAVVVVMSSTAGTTKAVIDKLRKEGRKVGLLKPILFRPFPYEEVSKALQGKKYIAVLDRSESYGANAPLYGEVKNAIYDLTNNKSENNKEMPKLKSYIFGLGGRDIFEDDIEKVFKDLINGNIEEKKVGYIGLRGEKVE